MCNLLTEIRAKVQTGGIQRKLFDPQTNQPLSGKVCQTKLDDLHLFKGYMAQGLPNGQGLLKNIMNGGISRGIFENGIIASGRVKVDDIEYAGTLIRGYLHG